jgi:hypothetical protein
VYNQDEHVQIDRIILADWLASVGQITFTDWLAFVGAITGVSSLGWNIYLQMSAGPRVSVKATPGMKLMPTPPGDPSYVRLVVRNTGTAATTLTAVTFHAYASEKEAKELRALKSFVVPQTTLPHRLEVGCEWSGLVKQDQEFDEFMHSDKLWCAIHHVFSETPAQVKVI